MKVHFIGICGVAMSAIAIAFKKAGFDVTGSDAGFFPPVSTNLEKHEVKFYPGWHAEKMIENGVPDLVIVGNVASSTNPEWLYVQEKKLNYLSYPEAIEKYFVKENSIVCAGTYGKTTTSALLAWVLSECGYNPSYMFGGIAVDDFDSAQISDSKYSILEGDEYKTSKWDSGAKFFHYHPTHLLLTDVKWDHADVYPTEQNYFEAFEKLIESVPKKGMIVANEKVEQMAKLSNCHIVTYGFSSSAMYQCSNVTVDKNGIKFNIIHQNTSYELRVTSYGDYWAENITGVFALACEIGIEPKKIIEAIGKFKGLKRRLEKRFENNSITIFDDIAHSSAKAQSVLETLRRYSESAKSADEESLSKSSKNVSNNANFKSTEKGSLPASGRVGISWRLICVFEPNTGNRQPQSEPSYTNAFAAADEVIIPTLTKLKTSDDLHHWDGAELVEIIKKTHNDVKYIEDDNKLINYLTNQQNSIIVFCGSHGFRGMIDQLVSKVSNKQSKHET